MDMLRPIEKTLDAFQLRDLQSFKNIIMTLGIDGWTVTDALDYIQQVMNNIKNPEVVFRDRAGSGLVKLKRMCPGCEKRWLLIEEVNQTPETMVGEGLNSQWYCPGCGWEEFSIQNILTEAKPYIEKIKPDLIPLTAQEYRRERRIAAQKTGGGK